MITLLDPPEDDDVLYSVLFSAPNPSSLPLQNMVAPSAEHALDMAVQDALRNTRMPSGSSGDYHHHGMLEEISTDDETDDEDYMGNGSEQDDSEAADSLRKELTAIEDSWGRHGLEHMIHVDEEERVDGIPTFTMPVNLDMSWDESDFLEEMAEDMKLLDDVAGRVLHEDQVDDGGIDTYMAHLEMIETSLKRELTSIEDIWKQHGVDLSQHKTTDDVNSSVSSDDGGDSLPLKGMFWEIDEMATFTESDDESSRREGDALDDPTDFASESSDYIVPIQELSSSWSIEFDVDEGSQPSIEHQIVYRALEESMLEQSISLLRSDHEQATHRFDKLTIDLTQRVASLQNELDSTRLELAVLREQSSDVTHGPARHQKVALRRLYHRTLALVQGTVLVGAVTFASLVILSTLQRRPLGRSNASYL